jgi:hypothetical protein
MLAFEIRPICPDLSGDRPGTLASRTTGMFWQFIQNNQGMRSQICLAGHPDFPSHAARIAWPAEAILGSLVPGLLVRRALLPLPVGTNYSYNKTSVYTIY